jgi:hypothetical protein
MIRKTSLFLLSSAWLSLPTNAFERIPKETNSSNILSHVNIFKKLSKRKTLHLAHSFGINETLPNSHRFTLSYRQKLTGNFSAGLITMLASGSRHNADWVNPSTGWRWQDTADRYEFNYGGYVQYKKLLNKRGSLLFKARVHYQINTFNNQQDLIFRTGLLSLISSKVSWLTQVDLHIPTNYQRSFLREYWVYSGLGRQMTKNIFLGLQASYGVEFWNESKNFFDRTNQLFKNKNQAFRIGPIINFYY